MSRTDNAYLLLIEGGKEQWSTPYAEHAQNPCKLGKRMCTNCRQKQMAKLEKPARSMAWASQKKNGVSFMQNTKSTRKIAPCLIVHINLRTNMIGNHYLNHFSACRCFGFTIRCAFNEIKHIRYLFRQPFSITFVLLQLCFTQLQQKRPLS